MVYNSIIGRNEEIRKLEKFLKSPKSEFVAIYGRRRVGKSYLVEEVYKDKIVFRAIGSYIKDKDPLHPVGNGHDKRCNTKRTFEGCQSGGYIG